MTETITIDGPRALELLREVVKGKEDYVYVNAIGEQADDTGNITCSYSHGPQPGCVVGHVLYSAGATIDQLIQLDHFTGSGSIEFATAEALDISREARVLLAAAQYAQDTGLTWGTALATAERAA